MDSYRDDVFRLMEMGSDEIISNGQDAHASALFECFFAYARKTVKILCLDLRPDVFDTPEVIGAATDALNRGVVIEVLVQNTPPEKSRFRALLGNADRDTCNRLSVEVDANRSPLIASCKANFAVMDGVAFRYEPDSSVCKASASMNMPQIAQKLTTAFFRLKGSLSVAQ